MSVEPSVLFYGSVCLKTLPLPVSGLGFFFPHFFNPGNLVKWRGMVPSMALSTETEASCCQSMRKILYVTKSLTVIKGTNCPKTPPFFTHPQGTGAGQSLCVYVRLYIPGDTFSGVWARQLTHGMKYGPPEITLK